MNHPIIKSYEPGENWKWCYKDKKNVYEINIQNQVILNNAM